MRVDDRRHHGLAGQVDQDRPRWHLDLADPAYLGDPIALDDEGAVLDGLASISQNEPRPLEDGYRGGTRVLVLLSAASQEEGSDQEQPKESRRPQVGVRHDEVPPRSAVG